MRFKDWIKKCNVSFDVKIIDCSENDLIDLNGIELYRELEVLDCGSNGLTNLQYLPSSLEYLNCSGNPLTELPLLPNSLNYLKCFDTNLIYESGTIDEIRKEQIKICRRKKLINLNYQL